MLPRKRKLLFKLIQRRIDEIEAIEIETAPKRPYMSQLTSKRVQFGIHAHLISDLESNAKEFKSYFRMNKTIFDELLDKVAVKLCRYPTRRFPIGARERLEMTLRKLASGESFQSLHFYYRCGVSTACKIFNETCRIIYENLKNEYLRAPTVAEWLQSAQQFWEKWQFPLCLGAIDGKHVQIKAPSNSGTDYFNYKGENSINLMAISDASYKLLYVSTGSKGRHHDSTVFMETELGSAIVNETANLPLPRRLPNTSDVTPMVFVADNAFGLRRNIMTPFAGDGLNLEQIEYNYRLPRARRCIENAFGLLRSRFRILSAPLDCSPTNADYIILASCCLHNYLICKDPHLQKSEEYCPPDFDCKNICFDESDATHWKKISTQEVTCNSPSGSQFVPQAQAIRQKFVHFFNQVHVLPWRLETPEKMLPTASSSGTQ